MTRRSSVENPAKVGIHVDIHHEAACSLSPGKRKKRHAYTGVTSNLVARPWQHREHIVDGFTKRYSVSMLVWYELHATMDTAIAREKQIKKWKRAWKLRLIQKGNPRWRDLWPEIIG